MTRMIPLAALFIALLVPDFSYAYGVATRICIENKSAKTYFISGVNVDSGDWEDVNDNGAMNRPDHNWVNYPLDPGDVRCAAADFNGFNKTAFDFAVRNGTGNPTLTRMVKHGDDTHTLWTSYPTTAPGSLGGTQRCADTKDPEYQFALVS